MACQRRPGSHAGQPCSKATRLRRWALMLGFDKKSWLRF
jgi:hypothetical protein